jgi:hypothetical protein
VGLLAGASVNGGAELLAFGEGGGRIILGGTCDAFNDFLNHGTL